MDSQCDLCGHQGRMVSLYPRQQIFRCPRCGLVFWLGRPQPQSLYTPAYFAGDEYRDYVGDKKLIQRDFADRIDALRSLKPSGRLLEIGCAYGFFLELAQRHWQVRGLDVVPECIAHARDRLGLNAELAEFLELPDECESYDVICMWDTLEHLRRPVECIRRAGRWLRPGGVLAITTNDIDSVVARVRGSKWRQIHPPTHLFYFSADTLRLAVASAALEAAAVSYVGYHRSYRSMAHGIFALRNPAAARLYDVLTLGGRLDFGVYLNLRDIMMFTARKPARRARLVPRGGAGAGQRRQDEVLIGGD